MSFRMRLLLGALFVAHAALGAGLGLSVDEAHYALYAAHPALSYFDHPPLVGWVQWPLVAGGASVAQMRWLPGLLWLATVWGVYRVALRMAAQSASHAVLASLGAPSFTASTSLASSTALAPSGVATPARAALWAVVALLAAPVLHVLGIGLLPDTLLMLLGVGLLWQTQTLMQPQALRSWGAWGVLGVLLGLAGLAKYTAVFSALAVAACLLGAHGWRLLGNGRLWLCAALALGVIAPVLVWNAQHDWLSFRYQAAHGAGSVWQFANVLRFVLVQLLAYGLLLAAGLLGAGRLLPGQRSLLLFFACPMLIFTAMSGGGSSLPHWTAPAWVALAPLAGLALARWESGAGSQRRRRALWGVVAVQGLLCAALPLLMLSAGMPWLQGRTATPQSSDAPNPFADLHGWQAAGERASALAQAHGLQSVAVQNWTLASRLGWYARPLPVHVLAQGTSQFSLWTAPLAKGAGTLLVDWSQLSYLPPVGPQGFAQCSLLERQTAMHWGYALAEFHFYACADWAGATPEPQLAPAAPATPATPAAPVAPATPAAPVAPATPAAPIAP